MKIDFGKLRARLAFGLTAAGAAVVAKPDLLQTHAGLLALAIVAVAGMVPVAGQPSGVLRPVSPGTVSLAEKIGGAVVALVNAPKAARQAQVQAIVDQAVTAGKAAGTQAATEVLTEAIKNQTGQFTVGELGGIVGKAAQDAAVSAVQGEVAKLEGAVN